MKTLLSIVLCAGLMSTAAMARGGYGHQSSKQQTVPTSTTVTQPVATTTVSTLTQEQIDDLVFMYQEEKMARDVYKTLGDTWGASIFYNIQSAEQNHMDAIKTLLVNYGIPVPVIEDTVGVFENQEIQALYDQLVSMGEESLTSAYNVGVLIEETDIADLEEKMADAPADVLQVYQTLLAGSYNHLAAFNRVIDGTYYGGQSRRGR